MCDEKRKKMRLLLTLVMTIGAVKLSFQQQFRDFQANLETLELIDNELKSLEDNLYSVLNSSNLLTTTELYLRILTFVTVIITALMTLCFVCSRDNTEDKTPNNDK